MAEIAGEPRYAPTILADKTTALTLANAVTAALFAREKTGRGQFVEVPMFETMVAFVLAEHLFGHCFTPPQGALGYTRVLGAWRRRYKTRDGYICMMAYTEMQWRKFWSGVGKPEICDDPRFDSIATRSRNVVALYETCRRGARRKDDRRMARVAAPTRNSLGAGVEPRRGDARSAARGERLLQARDAPKRRRDFVYRSAGALWRRCGIEPVCSRGSASTVSKFYARRVFPKPRSRLCLNLARPSIPTARRRQRNNRTE